MSKRKKCQTCSGLFKFCRSNARYCSVRCYRKSPTSVAWHKRYDDSLTKKKYWNSSAGRASFRRVGNKHELVVALQRMGAKRINKTTSVSCLYDALVTRVQLNKQRAKKLLKGGKPDAFVRRVEFKFGIDFLRADQLIFDILSSRAGKVRWFLSYDALEDALNGLNSGCILFSSYLRYLEDCEKATTLDFK
jgi:hypothetical protein